jgi:hypothetical protein
LRFEYRHMQAAEADECVELLASHGYRFVIEKRDIIAHLGGAEIEAGLTLPVAMGGQPMRRASA